MESLCENIFWKSYAKKIIDFLTTRRGLGKGYHNTTCLHASLRT